MSIFLLFQTDTWKSRASRIFFGAFDSRNEALDFARYHQLSGKSAAVVIVEVTLNQFGEI